MPASKIEILLSIKAEQDRIGDLCGLAYRSDLNLVFCDPNGDYLRPDTVTAKACLIAKKAALHDTSIHTLRHSHGSHLLSEGVPLPTVSKRLGHSSVYVTSTVYSHALTKDEMAAVDAWDKSIQQSVERSRDQTKVC